MPKYDAFGREIGEDTLAGLGETSERGGWQSAEPAARPDATWPAEGKPAEPAARPDATWPAEGKPAASTEDSSGAARSEQPKGAAAQPAATQRAALAAQLRGALSQVAATRPAAGAPQIVVRRSGGRGCLVAVAVLIFVIGGLGLVLGAVGGSIESGVEDVAGPIRERAAPPPDPRGLGPRSLVRRANLAPALAQLEATGLRVTHLRLAPERIDAQLLTRGGRLRAVQLRPGARLKRLGGDSGPGFDSTPRLPLARLRPGAPERLARQGAARLRVPVSTLQYLVPTVSEGKVTWAAYFTRGRYVVGDGAGRYQRSYP